MRQASEIDHHVVLRQGDKKWPVWVLGRFAFGSLSFDSDVCLLFTDREIAFVGGNLLKSELQPVQGIRISETLRVGERVFAVGAPEGLELTLSEGIVSRLERAEPLTDGKPESVKRIQTTAPISPGSSGGGLFDQQGNLIGITTSSVVGGQNLNFALPAGYASPHPRQ